MNRGRIVAILWAPEEGRTTEFAKHLGATLYRIHYLHYKRPMWAPIKYPPQCLKTWAVLLRQRPSVVYVMNPPVFAALSVFIYCRLFGASYVMDTHSPALYSRKWAWTVPLQRALAKQALGNIVDQDRFKHLFESWGAKALVLAQPPPSIPSDRLIDSADPNQFSVTVVNTFASDEPLEIVLGAAEQLSEFRFFVLGDTGLAKKALLRAAPDNVVFTGYLLGDAYWNQLHSSRVVMVLTTYPYSLLAGAQEAMGIGKPLILSKQPALTEFFTKGAVFVDHSVEGIVDGIREAQAQEHRLTQEIAHLAVGKQKRWEAGFRELLALIGDAPWKESQPGG